jgi:hypothetical protein
MRVAACAGYLFLGVAGLAVLLWGRNILSIRGRAHNHLPPGAPTLYPYDLVASRAKGSAQTNLLLEGDDLPLSKNGRQIRYQPKDGYIRSLANQQAELEAKLCQVMNCNERESNEARTQLMELLFTLSSSILDESLLWRREGLSFQAMFDNPDYYQHSYFGIFIQFYHHIRSGGGFDMSADNRLILRPRVGVLANEREFQDSFYREGNYNCYLRKLFNNLCSRAEHYAPAIPSPRDQIATNWQGYFHTYLTQDTREHEYITPPNLYNPRTLGGP